MENCRVVVCVLFIVVGFSSSSVVRAETSREGASGIVQMPAVTINPAPAIIYEGQSVEFNCTHSINIEANITWLRNGETLSGVTTESFLMGGSVVVEAVPSGWNGSQITCQISPTAQAMTELIVLSRGPTILTPPTNHSVREGESFALTCITRGLPTPAITWFKDGNIFHYSFLAGVEFSEGLLMFSRASDELAGVYECQAENTRGIARSALAIVEVFSPPSFSRTPQSTRVENGSSVTLMCSARGHPPPSISWTQNGNSITSGGRVEIFPSGDLRISSVATTDMGMYRCTGTNELGTIHSDDAVLVVLVAPLFLLAPDPTSVDSGEPVILLCTAFGIPLPSYTWFHDGVMVEGDTRVRVNNGTLQINSVRREDGGQYECRAENEVGEITSSALLQVYAPPPPPKSLQVTQKGATWVEIRWMANPDTNPPVQSYNVEYRLSFEHQRQQDNGTLNMRFNITGLYPNAHYLVQVRAESPKGVGEPSMEISVWTELGVPGPELRGSPENVTVEPITSRSLTIRWTIPDVLRRTSYNQTRVVVADPSGTRTSFIQEESPVHVNSLQPVTTYHIELTFVLNGNFMGQSFQITARTLEAAPSDAPTITNVTSTGPNVITLAWIPPSIPNGVIQSYTIRYVPTGRPSESSEVVVRGNQSVWEVQGLRAFTNYSVELSANTSVGEGPARVISIRTQEDVPPTAPANPIAEPLSPHSVRLSWQPLAEEDVPGELVKYTVKYHQKHRGGHPKFVHIEPNRTVHVLHGLKPFTEYRAMVAGATNAGTGLFSEMFFATTLGTEPTAVVRILSVTPECPSSLVVEWEEPDSSGIHAPREDVSFVVRFGRSDGSEDTVEVNGTTNYTIRDLEPFTVYNVSVAVQNSHGVGNFSEVVQNTTCEGVSTPPRDLTVHPVSSTALQLSWQQPEEIPGILVNYIVRFSAREIVEMLLPPNSTSYRINGLDPYTVYDVSVAAETGGGRSNFSRPVQGQTFTSVPTVPVRILSVTPECPSSLVVEWEEPDPSGVHAPPGDVSYVVRFRENGGTGTAMSNSVTGTTMFTLERLQLSTEYNVSVAVMNLNGTGQFGPTIQQSTPVGVPSAPRNVAAALPVFPRTLTITWSPPSLSIGIRRYNIHYIETSKSSLLDISDWMLNSTAVGQPNVTLQGLTPFTNYSIHVAAETMCGVGNYSETVLVESTAEDRSGPPTLVRKVASLPSSVVVGWGAPTMPNGEITGYNVSCPTSATHVSPTSRSHECRGLQSETAYNITVAALNSVGEGESASVSITTACEAPPPQVDTSLRLTVEAQSCFSASYTLVVVQVASDTPGRAISNYSLDELIASTEVYSQTRLRRQDDNEPVYIAANVTLGRLERGFQLGDGMLYGGFRNYMLDSDELYNVGLRSSVNGSDTSVFAVHSFVSPTSAGTTSSDTVDNPFPLVPVVASAGAVAVLVLAILVISIILCSCCCCNRSGRKNNDGPMERAASIRLSSRRKALDPVDEFRANHRTEALEEHPPVPVNGFVNKLLVMRTNDNQLFLEEFGSIQMAPQFPYETANLSCNQPKNRYNNILAYDHSRVRLSSIRGQQGSDYINANYCAGYLNQKTYIATQGPIPETVSDFWRMVWEENSRTIVMLTNTQERGKTKCETYWPRELGTSAMHGHLEVTLVSVIQLADYTIRSFTLRKGSNKEAREVRQFHFTSWPDHGVPQYSTAMLAMINRVRAYHQQGAGPMVVHCSAGVGRSGTFIVIDSMLERMKHKDYNVDIYGHVSLLRAQRNYMVQTEDQYFFIYEAVAEAIVCGNTEVPMDQLPGYVRELCQVIPQDEQDTTFIELEFKRLVIDKNDPHRFATANRDANKCKNRYVNVLPYETNRVCLDYLRGVDGSDYINASHIDSYHTRKAFIMTQGPLNNTVVDFWRMVVQHNTPIVVMLTQLVEKGTERCVQYWPGEPLHSETYGGNTVEMTVERNSGPYTYRELHVTNNESGQKRLVRHFQFHGWPEVGVPGTPLILMEFIREIQKLHITLNTKAPVVVHCSNGIGRSGVFVALHNIIERMQVEGLVDVFQTVKNLRIQRPAAVQTLVQYQFCYDAAVDFLQSSDMLLHFRQRSMGSSASLRSRKSRTSSPARNESSMRPPANRSSRNFELNRNSGSHIYGGSDATSTFGTQHTNSSPFSGSLNGVSGSQLLPQNGPDQRYSGVSNFSSHSGEA